MQQGIGGTVFSEDSSRKENNLSQKVHANKAVPDKNLEFQHRPDITQHPFSKWETLWQGGNMTQHTQWMS